VKPTPKAALAAKPNLWPGSPAVFCASFALGVVWRKWPCIVFELAFVIEAPVRALAVALGVAWRNEAKSWPENYGQPLSRLAACSKTNGPKTRLLVKASAVLTVLSLALAGFKHVPPSKPIAAFTTPEKSHLFP